MANSPDDLVMTDAAAGQIIGIPPEVLLRNDPGPFVAGIESATDTASDADATDVSAVNEAPSGKDALVILDEDSQYTFSAADFGFSDPDGNALAAIQIATLPAQGTLYNDADGGDPANAVSVTPGQSISAEALSAGKLFYRPAANASGVSFANFRFQVQDDGGTQNGGHDLDATPNVIKLRVTPVPDAPVAVDDNPNTSANPVVANPASPIVSYQGPISVLVNDSDADTGEAVLLRVTKVGVSEASQVAVAQTGITTVAGIYGSLLIKWSGNYEYRLDSSLAATMSLAAGVQATEHFVYTAANNGGGVGNEDVATISIVVQGANDAPRDLSLSSHAVDENAANGIVIGTLSAVDSDGDPITWTLSDSAGGRFAVDPNTGVVTVADGSLLDFENQQSYTISATATDGTLSSIATQFTISLNDVNEAPTAQFIQNSQAFSITENVATADQERGLLNIFDDALGTNIVSLSGQYAGLFYFTTAGGTYYLHLKSGFVPDFESDSAIEVTVNIDDPTIGDGPEVSFVYTVNVLNIDEAAVTSPVTIAVDEDTVRVLTAADFPYRDPEGVRAMTAVEIISGPSNGKLFYDPTGGDPSDAIQVTGSRTVSKAALDAGQLWFVAAPGGNGAAYANFNFQVVDSQGLSNFARMTFDVVPMNDAPVWSNAAGGGDYAEGDTVVLRHTIAVSDIEVDALNGGLGDYSSAILSLQRESGAVAADVFGFDTAGANFIVVGNALQTLSGDSFASFSSAGGVLTLTFGNNGATPTSALVNDVLQHITYTSHDDNPADGDVAFRWELSDGNVGDQGSGGELTGTATTELRVRPVNDAPVNDVPGAQAVDENVALIFAAARGNAITIGDIDAADRDLTVRLEVAHGTLTLGATDGLAQVEGNGTRVILLRGDLATINSALEGLSYRGSLNYSGSDTLTITTDDRGNTGSGHREVDEDTVAITVNNVIVAPETDGASLSGNENTALAVTLSGTDSDGTVVSFRIFSLPQNGALFLDAAGTTPIDPNNIAATGGVAVIYFVPDLDFSGHTGFQYFAVDNDGAADASSAFVSIQVAMVNNAPVVSGPVTLAMPEDGMRLITQMELLGTASDSDGSPLNASNLAIASGDGRLVDNHDGTWSYTSAPDDDTAVTFSYLVTDGIAAAVAASASLDITPVNDAPVNAVPGARQIEANAIVAIAGLAISDADAGSGILTTTLSVAHGTLTIAAVGGAVVSGSGTGTVTINGTLAQIDATLGAADNVVYASQHDFSGTDTLTMTTTDNGNTGGGALTDTDQVAIIVSAAAEKPVEHTDPPATQHSDFLWQNQDGTAALWTMNGLTVTVGAHIGSNPGPAWHVLGTGDFNGDGKADILWQNADGTPAVWLLDGFNLIGGANVGFNPGAAWHVIAAADFNGDGKSDILWQNADGTPAIWLMDGLNLLGGANVGFNPGAAWHAIGAGDFDGDGKADILWQNQNGQAAVWLMNGLSLAAGADIGLNPGAAWQVQAAGDFNGDGKADILWQNTDGSPAIWLMNGFNVLSGANVGFNPGPNWKIHGSGDFNGDGKADIAWQNADGTPAVWLMDGLNVVAGSNVGFNPGSSWHAIPQHHDLFG
jgi:VCBS repeat-containing protein